MTNENKNRKGERKMVCNKCGNELADGEKFCGKCGSKTNNKKGLIKIIVIICLIIIVAVLLIIGGLYFYGKDIKIGNTTIKNFMSNTGISNEYITKQLKENMNNDNIEAKILAITDIEYEDFNKLILVKASKTNDGTGEFITGFLLVNKKEDKIESITMGNDVFILSNAISNNKQECQEILDITAKYIKTLGTEVFTNIQSDNYKSYIKKISNEIGLEKSRNYIETSYKNLMKQQGTTTDFTILFAKQSAYIQYIAFYESTTKFNSSWPIDENTYKYFSRDYSHKSTLNTLEYIYGAPYKIVKEYVVYTIGENPTVKGRYSTLEEARLKLDVD